MDHPFRKATFGGFNRQDVLTYLENAAQESAQAQQELRQQLDQAQETVTRQEGQLNEQGERLTALAGEIEGLRVQLEQANIALSASRTEAGGTANELQRVCRELEQANARAAALEPDATAYQAVKERTAGVELEAHRRAQAIQEQAEGQARHLRRQMEQWMQRVEREYDALRTQVESTVSHAADELDKAGKCLEQANALLGEQDIALEALAQAYADTEPAKVAAPMPIPEN